MKSVSYTTPHPPPPSVNHAGLIGWHHVLDVDEGVLSPIPLQHLQSLLNEVAYVLSLLLAVVDAVSSVDCGTKRKMH